jgi:hypothetical protein
MCLPKSAVSRVSDLFKTIKKDGITSDTDNSSNARYDVLDHQEKNILKIFATTGGNYESQSTDNMILFLFVILPASITVVFVAVWMEYLIDSGQQLILSILHMQTFSSQYISDICAMMYSFLVIC